MEIKTFDTILTGLCDSFDSLISPKKISRSNVNIIYLMFKAIAKGYEVINNVCVVLSNKFNPATCSEEDLESVASLVGTERLQGSASGLHILIHNDGEDNVTLYAGEYTYAQSDDVKFVFELIEDTVIEAGKYITVIAMSENIGSYAVTEQASIEVTASVIIPDDITFSCTDNNTLLGTSAESDIEFRKRILEDTDTQDSITELQNELRNLPYLFDCRVKFNNTMGAVDYYGITIPPFYALICYSGAIKSEIADVIANKLICPTVETDDAQTVYYNSDAFVDGHYPFHLVPFAKEDFSVSIIYKASSAFVNAETVEDAMRKALENKFVAEVHKDYVKEDEIYETVSALNLSGVNILGINLIKNGQQVDYVSVPTIKVPNLVGVTFSREE